MTAASPVISSAHRPPVLVELWRYRGMLRAITVRNLKVKYQRSALGFVWTLLNPLLMVGILVVVFSHIVKIPIPQYWAFLLSGYFAWNFISQGIGTATYVFLEHAPLRRGVAFPSEVLVLGALASRLVEFAAELVPVLVVLLAFHFHGVPASVLLLPVLVVLQLLIVLGIMLPLAAASVFYRDIQHALPIALVMLFYASPVFYPATMVPPALRAVYLVNPIAGLLTLYQQVLYEGHVPSPALLAGVAAESLVIAVIGYGLFRRHKHVFAEVV